MGDDDRSVDLQTQVSDEMYQRMQDKVPGASTMTKSQLTHYCLARFLELDDLEKARAGLGELENDSE